MKAKSGHNNSQKSAKTAKSTGKTWLGIYSADHDFGYLPRGFGSACLLYRSVHQVRRKILPR